MNCLHTYNTGVEIDTCDDLTIIYLIGNINRGYGV